MVENSLNGVAQYRGGNRRLVINSLSPCFGHFGLTSPGSYAAAMMTVSPSIRSVTVRPQACARSRV